MTESSAPHGAEVYRRDSEAEGRGGSEGTCCSGDGKEIRQVKRGEVVNSFESVQKDFEFNSLFDREPVKLL